MTPDEEDRGKCDACHNTGWARVPHPAHCDATEWRPYRTNAHGKPIYATACVLCHCHVGHRFLDSQRSEENKDRAKAMTLAYYSEFVNSNWRAQIRERERLDNPFPNPAMPGRAA
jgi:hypothetical protein